MYVECIFYSHISDTIESAVCSLGSKIRPMKINWLQQLLAAQNCSAGCVGIVVMSAKNSSIVLLIVDIISFDEAMARSSSAEAAVAALQVKHVS